MSTLADGPANTPRMAVRRARLSELHADPANARKHDDRNLGAISASLRQFGQVEPLVVQKSTGKVIGGNGRMEVLRRAGETECDIVEVDVNDTQAAALGIALNRTSELAMWDDSALAALLQSLPEDAFAATGFDSDDLGALLDKLAPGTVEEDEVPEPPEEAVTREGDLWLLGEHRVLCGDSTRAQNVQRIFGGQRAAMCFTDPPWNVAIGQDANPRHRQRPGLRNDDLSPEGFEAFLDGFIAAMIPVLNGDLYCVLGASEWPTLDKCLRERDFHWSATVIWVKDVFVLGRSKYHRRYEPVWYGWHEKATSSFSAGRDQDDVWEIPRPRRSEEHPTMKPVESPARAIGNSSKRGEVVYDGFLGAGSTLIAAEQLSRRCYGIELEPRFTDVCVMRWQDQAGASAVLDGDGRSFAEIAAERIPTREKAPTGVGAEGTGS